MSRALLQRARERSDRWDQMWDGAPHVAAPPANRHQRLGSAMAETLRPVDARGLEWPAD